MNVKQLKGLLLMRFYFFWKYAHLVLAKAAKVNFFPVIKSNWHLYHHGNRRGLTFFIFLCLPCILDQILQTIYISMIHKPCGAIFCLLSVLIWPQLFSTSVRWSAVPDVESFIKNWAYWTLRVNIRLGVRFFVLFTLNVLYDWVSRIFWLSLSQQILK